jgi:hypothetical protein
VVRLIFSSGIHALEEARVTIENSALGAAGVNGAAERKAHRVLPRLEEAIAVSRWMVKFDGRDRGLTGAVCASLRT